jgi:hypothetical protein
LRHVNRRNESEKLLVDGGKKSERIDAGFFGGIDRFAAFQPLGEQLGYGVDFVHWWHSLLNYTT